jgi:elongator complex protein 3
MVTSAGVDRTNLRQYVKKVCDKKGIKCKCIRCREPKNVEIDFKNIKINVHSYEASGGKEFFIAAEDHEVLAGFCRLRFVESSRLEIENSAGIRELHVYGSATAIGEKGDIQHRGIGKRLVSEAEKIAKENGKNKMLIISGIGARQYYKKLGYEPQGPYMARWL